MLRTALVLIIALGGPASAGEFVPRKPAAADPAPAKPAAKPTARGSKRPATRTAAKKSAPKAKKKAAPKSDKYERRPLP